MEHSETLQSLSRSERGTRAQLRNSIPLGTIPGREAPGRPPSLASKVSANQAGGSRPVCAAHVVNSAISGERTAAHSIIEARRRRLGADYEPVRFPAESYAGGLTVVHSFDGTDGA